MSMTLTPYEFLKPVTPDTSFVGRDSLVDAIIEQCIQKDGMSFAIVGGRRFGKTSLLHTVKYRLAKVPNTVCVLISIQQHPLSSNQFWESTYKNVLGAAVFHHISYRTHSNLLKPPRTFANFLDQIQEILRSSSISKIIFMYDEMDSLLDYKWCDELFDQMRTLIDSSPVRDSTNLVLAGTRFYHVSKQRGSPLMNLAAPCYLESLCREDIKKLINKGGVLEDDVSEMVWEYSGGHPHLAQYILHRLWISHPNFDGVVAEDVHRAVNKYMSEQDQNLHNWMNEIGPEGAKIYAFLSQAYGEWKKEEDISAATKISMLDTNQTLRKLCFHGIVGLNDATGEYRAQGLLFREWFSRYGNAYHGGREREESKKDRGEIHVEINGDAIGSAIIIGGKENIVEQHIEHSFNTPSNPDLAPLLAQLTQAVEEMLKHLPAEQAQEARDDLKRLQEELQKPQPRKKVSIEGLIQAAKNVGAIGAPVIELAGKILQLLP